MYKMMYIGRNYLFLMYKTMYFEDFSCFLPCYGSSLLRDWDKLNFNTMKQPFDNVGFAQVQASTISLDATALQATVQQIRSNFAQWMKDTFELSASQQEQLDDLEPTFRQDLADAVADSWAVRHPILFYKEEDGTAKAAKERSV